jgi:hypothetical protein
MGLVKAPYMLQVLLRVREHQIIISGTVTLTCHSYPIRGWLLDSFRTRFPGSKSYLFCPNSDFSNERHVVLWPKSPFLSRLVCLKHRSIYKQHIYRAESSSHTSNYPIFAWRIYPRSGSLDNPICFLATIYPGICPTDANRTAVDRIDPVSMETRRRSTSQTGTVKA